ncbi:chemotaxis protein CheD [Halobacillus sp. Marseille-P3879]|uniref:chemotaxis protein CheD n=1 Tax=Halobacillus TaxID=45667 RepID=UPI000C7987F6|nr:chemotaxis protein CheD [Halobacillus sp. Marseille-P3879]
MNKVSQVVKVGIADMNIVTAPEVLKTSGLGSCVGVVLYDAGRAKAGMVHIMLPNFNYSKNAGDNPAKYADSGIELLYHRLIKAGGCPQRFTAKIAGGAQMFQFSTDMMRIGPRNVEAVKSKLLQLNIPLEAADVGGKCGRTIEFDPSSCLLNVRTVHKGERII